MSMSRAVRTLPRPRLLALSATAIAATAATLVSADLRQDYRPAAYAIRGAMIVAGPEKTVADGTVVVREGVIEAVGPSAGVAVPFDAEVIEGKGLVVYPGFLDLGTTLGQPAGAVRSRTDTMCRVAATMVASRSGAEVIVMTRPSVLSRSVARRPGHATPASPKRTPRKRARGPSC